MPELSREWRYVLMCVRFASGVIGADECKGAEDLCWDEVLHTLAQHRLLPFAYLALPIASLPHSLQLQCRLAIASCDRSVAEKLRQFKFVASLLDQHSIPYAPLKGVANHATIYATDPYRAMNDLDLLLHRGDMSRAYEVLWKQGFRPFRRPSRHRWHDRLTNDEAWRTIPHPLDRQGRLMMVRQDFEIDVHCDPMYGVSGEYNPCPNEFYWEGATIDATRGSSLYQLAPERDVLLQLLHAAGDANPKLSQLVDVIRLSLHHKINLQDVTGQPWLHNRKHIDEMLEFLEALCRGDEFSGNEAFLVRLVDRQVLPPFGSGVSTGKMAVLFHFQVLQRLCLQSKVLYLIGFFCPNPDYYKDKSKIQTWLLFARSFAGVFGRLLRSAITGK